jgi:hypothetical protein
MVLQGVDIRPHRKAPCLTCRGGEGVGAVIWDDDTKAKLRKMWNDGKSASEIGLILGCSKNAVIGTKNRIDGVSKRPSPIKASDPAGLAKAKALLSKGASLYRAVKDSGISNERLRKALREGEFGFVRHSPAATLPQLSLFDDEPQPSKVLPMFVVAPAVKYVPHGGCYFPMWKDDERPKFRNGSPLLCGEPIAAGSYCREHVGVCYQRVRVREAA